MNWLVPRLVAALAVVYFSLAELGRSGSYVHAIFCALALFGMFHLGRLVSKDSIDTARSQWLSVRERFASVRVDFERGGFYRQHRVCWFEDDMWHEATGECYEEAIDAAMKNGATFGEKRKGKDD